MGAHGIPQPRWFRGATAKYSPSAIAEIRSMGYRIAGYSLNGDSGASLPAKLVEKNYASAKDGDVLISHINQPTHSSGEGVVKGILALKARGTQFVRLQDIAEHGDDATTE
jgi:peptidoglycan/xylan/chitin deacetylase (PgdA/CDA1 family)